MGVVKLVWTGIERPLNPYFMVKVWFVADFWVAVCRTIMRVVCKWLAWYFGTSLLDPHVGRSGVDLQSSKGTSPRSIVSLDKVP